jgi:hypothetical protein
MKFSSWGIDVLIEFSNQSSGRHAATWQHFLTTSGPGMALRRAIIR